MERSAPRRSWLAPVAAALAIATTIAGVAVAVQAVGLFGGARGASSPASSTFTKPPWPSGDNRMPAYYVTIDFGKSINLPPSYYRGPKITGEIKVVNLVTGSVRTWTTRRNVPLGDGPSEPSWGDSRRLLGFLWNGHDGVPDRGFYVLHATAPGSNLMAARRLFRGTGLGLDAYLTAPGQTVIADMDAGPPPPGASLRDGYPSIVEYSARTGHLIRTLYGPPRIATPAGYGVVSVDPSGKYLLVAAPHFGRLVNGKFTRLAMKPGVEPVAAW